MAGTVEYLNNVGQLDQWGPSVGLNVLSLPEVYKYLGHQGKRKYSLYHNCYLLCFFFGNYNLRKA